MFLFFMGDDLSIQCRSNNKQLTFPCIILGRMRGRGAIMSTLSSFFVLVQGLPSFVVYTIYIQCKYFLFFPRDNVRVHRTSTLTVCTPCFPVPSYQQTQPSSFSSVLPQSPLREQVCADKGKGNGP